MFCFYIHCIVLFYAIWPYGHKNEIKVYVNYKVSEDEIVEHALRRTFSNAAEE